MVGTEIRDFSLYSFPKRAVLTHLTIRTDIKLEDVSGYSPDDKRFAISPVQ